MAERTIPADKRKKYRRTDTEIEVIEILCELTDAIGWKETPENLDAFAKACHAIGDLVDGKERE